MKPEIRRYLDEHGETYTLEALRQGLIDGGHSPADVDAALSEWHAERATARPTDNDRRRFAWWAFGLHGAVLVLVAIWLLTRPDAFTYGGGPTTLVVLAAALAIGWAISSAMGRRLLPAWGVAVALVMPALSALFIGGTCVSMFGLSGV